MKKKITGIVGVLLSIFLLIYFEPFIYTIISKIGIDINNYSSIVRSFIDIGIKLLLCIFICFVYKKNIRRRRSNDSILKNSLYLFVYLIVLTIVMYLFRYVQVFIGDMFDIEVLSLEFTNIFNKKLDIDLIISIVNNYVLIPFIYCSVIILSVSKFCRRNDTTIVFGGLLASVIYAFSLNGTLGFVIVNSLYVFLLFGILSYLYKRTNSIIFIVTLYSFYLICNSFIISYLGW